MPQQGYFRTPGRLLALIVSIAGALFAVLGQLGACWSRTPRSRSSNSGNESKTLPPLSAGSWNERWPTGKERSQERFHPGGRQIAYCASPAWAEVWVMENILPPLVKR